MAVELAFRPYQRRFAQPLRTAHGPWIWREGLIIRLCRLGRIGYGEVAPISWFGSESLADALVWAAQGEGSPECVPDGLPATQFGLACALANLDANDAGLEPSIADICGLVPAGEAAETALKRVAQGHRTLKWKIGVFSTDEETQWLDQLVKALPQGIRLRLDANGGLSLSQAKRWLAMCDSINAGQLVTIEHLEQPLPPDQVAAMAALGSRYQTAIALDESVATLAQLEYCWARGWRGVFVVKPAIAGLPQRLQAFYRQHRPRLVFSSAFETCVGRRAALDLAYRCSQRPIPALGFGTQGWFDDDWDTLTPAELWDRL
ncbi:MAG: o-succinylbenzoate synthase [Nodosilinea sp.]